MNKEARIGTAGEPLRRASAAGLHRQNVTEIELKFGLQKTVSKIKDEPTMLMKISHLKNDKMPDATMLLNLQYLT
jgi:hypothetical protein